MRLSWAIRWWARPHGRPADNSRWPSSSPGREYSVVHSEDSNLHHTEPPSGISSSVIAASTGVVFGERFGRSWSRCTGDKRYTDCFVCERATDRLSHDVINFKWRLFFLERSLQSHSYTQKSCISLKKMLCKIVSPNTVPAYFCCSAWSWTTIVQNLADLDKSKKRLSKNQTGIVAKQKWK